MCGDIFRFYLVQSLRIQCRSRIRTQALIEQRGLGITKESSFNNFRYYRSHDCRTISKLSRTFLERCSFRIMTKLGDSCIYLACETCRINFGAFNFLPTFVGFRVTTCFFRGINENASYNDSVIRAVKFRFRLSNDFSGEKGEIIGDQFIATLNHEGEKVGNASE